MEPLKEMFNKKFYERLCREFAKIYPAFKAPLFLKEVTEGIESLSLNGRLRKTSLVLKNHLPRDYRATLPILSAVAPNMPGGYTSLIFPDYVGLYGKEHFDLSMEALRYFTSFGSSEFAVREFLKHDLKRSLATMKQWAKDKDPHVRRLASEGSRPRLPWSFKLDAMIDHPELTKTILEQLAEDPELYVRKSVANHLNDISKDNPDYMLQLTGSWDKTNPLTAWIVKHASRSLIKKGHAGSLAAFDFEKNTKVDVENFELSPGKLKLGERLSFSFDLVSKKSSDQKLAVDYVVHYRKKSAELAPKVFKLKELTLKPKQRLRITKSQLFKDFTTRKHAAGTHVVEIQVNGKIIHRGEFYLQT